MSKQIDALKLAISRLEWFIDSYPHDITTSKEDFLRPFKEALAQPEQEPVANGKLTVTLQDTPTEIELAQYKRMLQAACADLGAINEALGLDPNDGGAEPILLAIEELRGRSQEPMAWMVYTLDGTSVCVTDNPSSFTPEHRALPLYTTPPQTKKPEQKPERHCENCAEHGECRPSNPRGCGFDADDAEHTQATQKPYSCKPVAWRVWNPDGDKQYAYSENGDGEPLYTASPQRKQVPPSAYESLLRDMTTIAAKEVPNGCSVSDFARHALADAELREHDAPQRKPLTDEQVREIAKQYALSLAFPYGGKTTPEMFARAIEAAHGIKGEA